MIKNRSFFIEWIWLNFIGWLTGVSTGVMFGQFFLAPILLLSSVYVSSHLNFNLHTGITYSLLQGVFVWLPIGASIGICQSIKMKRFNIPPIHWIAATSLGWTIPAILISFLYNQNLQAANYDGKPDIILFGAGTLMIGIGVGVFQALAFGKTNTWRGWLILGNVLSLVICIASIGILIFLALNLLPTEAEIGDRTFGLLMWLIILFFLPFVGIIASIPTGMVLVKFIDDQIVIARAIDGKAEN